jgi:hypothetical protein
LLSLRRVHDGFTIFSWCHAGWWLSFSRKFRQLQREREFGLAQFAGANETETELGAFLVPAETMPGPHPSRGRNHVPHDPQSLHLPASSRPRHSLYYLLASLHSCSTRFLRVEASICGAALRAPDWRQVVLLVVKRPGWGWRAESSGGSCDGDSKV